MKKIQLIIKSLKDNKNRLEDDFNVKQIGVFGSYVRGEQTKKSDLDILVEFKKPIGLFKFMDLEEYLEKLSGKKVDLVSKKALKPHIGKHILSEVKFV